MNFKIKLIGLLVFFLLALQVVPAIAADSNASANQDQNMYQKILQEKPAPNQATSAQQSTVNMQKANTLISNLKVKENATTSTMTEVEPNNYTYQANNLNLDQIAKGTITDNYYDLDYYKLTITKAGTLLVAGAMGSTSYSTENQYFAMAILDSNGDPLNYSTYYSSSGTYGQFISYDVDPGTYYIAALQTDESGYYVGEQYNILATMSSGSSTDEDPYLTVTPETVNILYGKTQKVKITLVDNGDTSDVTSKCKFESADPETASVKGATIKGEGVGNTAVTATYNDLSVDFQVNVLKPVATLTAEPSSLSLVVDGDAQIDISATYKGEDAAESIESGNVTWATKKKDDIVTVDEYGQVHADKTGTTTITATYGGKTVSIPVTVTEPVDQIIILPTEVGVAKGKTQAVTIYAIFGDNPDKLVDVSKNITLTRNDDDDLVSVSGTTIKGLDTGETSVYGSYGGQDIEIPVVVTEPIKSLEEDSDTTELELGIDQTETLSLTANYKDGSSEGVSQRVIAVSSKSSVATVDTSDGGINITGVSKGTSTITLSYEGKKVTVKVTVSGDEW